MDGKEIMNSFKRETFYEFSEAVPVFNDKIYFIFKVDIISIDMNPSKSRIDKLKILTNNKNAENSISHLDIEPIAYLLKTENNSELDYQIESLNEKYDPFIEKDIIQNQYHSLDAFLSDIDLVVIMVKHDEIKGCWDKLKGKIILDCHNICPLEGTYHI